MRLSASLSTLLVVALMVASCAAADVLGNEGQAHGRSLLQRGKKKAAPKAAKSPKPAKNAGGGKGKGKKSPRPPLGMSPVPSPSPTASPTPSPSPVATPSPSPVATPSPSPTATPSPSPTGTSNDFAGTNCDDPAAMLFVNNNFRVDHQVTGVSWNAQLAADSTAYAAVLANKDNCKLEHSTPQARGNAGENLAVYMSTAPHNESCTQAVNSWYNEVKDYNFNAARPFQDNWNQPKQIGHFTALVWKGTTSMGCGRALGAYRFSNGMTGTCKVIVCRYAPPGNVGSDQAFRDNVLPAKPKGP